MRSGIQTIGRSPQVPQQHLLPQSFTKASEKCDNLQSLESGRRAVKAEDLDSAFKVLKGQCQWPKPLPRS